MTYKTYIQNRRELIKKQLTNRVSETFIKEGIPVQEIRLEPYGNSISLIVTENEMTENEKIKQRSERLFKTIEYSVAILWAEYFLTKNSDIPEEEFQKTAREAYDYFLKDIYPDSDYNKDLMVVLLNKISLITNAYNVSPPLFHSAINVITFTILNVVVDNIENHTEENMTNKLLNIYSSKLANLSDLSNISGLSVYGKIKALKLLLSKGYGLDSEHNTLTTLINNYAVNTNNPRELMEHKEILLFMIDNTKYNLDKMTDKSSPLRAIDRLFRLKLVKDPVNLINRLFQKIYDNGYGVSETGDRIEAGKGIKKQILHELYLYAINDENPEKVTIFTEAFIKLPFFTLSDEVIKSLDEFMRSHPAHSGVVKKVLLNT